MRSWYITQPFSSQVYQLFVWCDSDEFCEGDKGYDCDNCCDFERCLKSFFFCETQWRSKVLFIFQLLI